MKRVVITGIGVVSCLGNNQEEVYQSLLNSQVRNNFFGGVQRVQFKKSCAR